MNYKYTDDDYCDIYENKICDNCGKCLEMEGIDTKAIKIEDIAKTQEENALLEEEFLNDLRSSLDEDELNEVNEENLDLKEIYNKFGNNINSNKKATLSIQKKSTKMLLII
ncbi:tRNA U34 5-methylaminomethyl-2-thiouridine-forming methyltransferase MnmC [Clostridium saccharobutylicum]|nr:tRNA U34 5-methylaminomethyl-2-thiouridine-forming methyltransferase MnmC [Clostridium saccharobutylicum]